MHANGHQQTQKEIAATADSPRREWVPAVIADNPSAAGVCRAVLETSDIEASAHDSVAGRGIPADAATGKPVLMPEATRGRAVAVLTKEACRGVCRLEMSGGDDDDDFVEYDDEDDADEDEDDELDGLEDDVDDPEDDLDDLDDEDGFDHG